jgi:hypothetical protein
MIMNVGELIEELGALIVKMPVAVLCRLGDFCIFDEPLPTIRPRPWMPSTT